jgi:GNAT superfamily N-acetyltransferase
MVAINVALEVDLTGQVCADSLGTRFYSGIGGQVDFNRGAARAEHGKAIIALPATARGGEVSRIVTYLSPGAGVVTTRGDVHYVVTEHGVAYLHGKSIQERALALISIADPRFRPQLVREALEAKYLRQNLADLEGRIHVGPRELTTSMLLDDGTQISLRAMHPTDEPAVRELFYNLSQQAIYYRFMSHLKRIPEQRIQNFVYIDHRNDVAIVAYQPEAHGDEILAIGRYYLDPTTNRAEVAFTVRDDWHNRGIGSFLLRYLINIARRNGISGFTAEILTENKAMQAVMQKTGHAARTHRESGVVHIELDF